MMFTQSKWRVNPRCPATTDPWMQSGTLPSLPVSLDAQLAYAAGASTGAPVCRVVSMVAARRGARIALIRAGR